MKKLLFVDVVKFNIRKKFEYYRILQKTLLFNLNFRDFYDKVFEVKIEFHCDHCKIHI